MMKIKLYYALVIIFLLISNLVVSQPHYDSTTVSSEYLFPQYTDGIVLSNNGTVFKGKLNYDTSSDQMKFIDTNNEIMYLSEPDNVKKVTIANRNFIYFKKYFVEIISEGPVCLGLRIHEKQYREKNVAYGGSSATSSVQSVFSISLQGGIDHKLSSNDKVRFVSEFIFYVMNNGKSRIVLNKNDLLKCFPLNKEIIKQEIGKQHTNFSSDDSMKKMIHWINANGIKD